MQSALKVTSKVFYGKIKENTKRLWCDEWDKDKGRGGCEWWLCAPCAVRCDDFAREGWQQATLRFGCLLVALASVNECVGRNN